MRIAARRRCSGILAFVVLATAITLAACGSSSSSSTSSTSSSSSSSSAASGASEIKMGAALFGPKNDKSFNQASYQGMLEATKQNPNLKLTAVLENRNTTQSATDAVQTLAPLNKVFVGVSQTFGPVFDVVASKFPKNYFIDIAGYTSKFHDNVTGFANDWGAPAYVGGVIAAHMTKSNVIGYVGGAEIPPTTDGAHGFAAGAKSVNPNIKVLTNIVGDFNDVAKAKAATAAMITDNADVIFPFLDAGIAGSYAAGKESGKNPAMFKLTIPDCGAYPNVVGTELVDNTAATKRLLDQYVHGQLKPGTVFLDLQEPQLQTLKLCPKYQSNAAIAKVTQDTIDGINSGKIKLPANAMNPRPSYPYQEGFNGKVVNPG
jgi:basic membrane protein A and related proteins